MDDPDPITDGNAKDHDEKVPNEQVHISIAAGPVATNRHRLDRADPA